MNIEGSKCIYQIDAITMLIKYYLINCTIVIIFIGAFAGHRDC